MGARTEPKFVKVQSRQAASGQASLRGAQQRAGARGDCKSTETARIGFSGQTRTGQTGPCALVAHIGSPARAVCAGYSGLSGCRISNLDDERRDPNMRHNQNHRIQGTYLLIRCLTGCPPCRHIAASAGRARSSPRRRKLTGLVWRAETHYEPPGFA